ncbi:hypothetical protein MVEN_00875000 [Mycena venus]|uniref:Uncharacterized protein n=1 Tax=Mycena venus TaxID=2733690 RepID=A0A8H6YFX2_9AGAR|nr:hypothetical protein MVEN_00875000 [Mycena venus]
MSAPNSNTECPHPRRRIVVVPAPWLHSFRDIILLPAPPTPFQLPLAECPRNPIVFSPFDDQDPHIVVYRSHTETPTENPEVGQGLAGPEPRPRLNREFLDFMHRDRPGHWLEAQTLFLRRRPIIPGYFVPLCVSSFMAQLAQSRDISAADAAHEIVVAMIVARWWVCHVVGPRDRLVWVCWNRLTENYARRVHHGSMSSPVDLRVVLQDLVFRANIALRDHLAHPDDWMEGYRALEHMTFLENMLLWLAQQGATVAMSIRWTQHITELHEHLFPDRPGHLLELRLRLVRFQDVEEENRFSYFDSLFQREVRVHLLSPTWRDPRDFNVIAHWRQADESAPVKLDFEVLMHIFDEIADVGWWNGTGPSMPPARVLEGDELLDLLAERRIDPSSVYGVPPLLTVPTRPRSPHPTREPRWWVQDEEEERQHQEEEERRRNEPPTPPSNAVPPVGTTQSGARSKIPHQRPPANVPTGPRAMRERNPPPRRSSSRPCERKCARRTSSSPPAPPSPSPPPPPPPPAPAAPLPVPAAGQPAPALVADPSRSIKEFRAESYCPRGTVIRELLPRCGRCARELQFCTEDSNLSVQWPNHPSLACGSCHKGHGPCPQWNRLHEAYTNKDQHELGRLRFQYWEHLGGGQYQLLIPDHRTANLYALSEHTKYRELVYGLRPRQNTERARAHRTRDSPIPPGDSSDKDEPVVRPPHHRSHAARVPSSSGSKHDESEGEEDVEMPPAEGVIDDLMNFDLDEEPAPTTRSTASSSQAAASSSCPRAPTPVRPVFASSPPVQPSSAVSALGSESFEQDVESVNEMGAEELEALRAYLEAMAGVVVMNLGLANSNKPRFGQRATDSAPSSWIQTRLRRAETRQTAKDTRLHLGE